MSWLVVPKVIFWLSGFLVLYTYLLYPCLLFLVYASVQSWRDLRYVGGRENRRVGAGTSLPRVALVISAYNEQDCIADKIDNILATQYPDGLFRAVIVSDGSTDGTNSILATVSDPRIKIVLLPENQGKANALNQAVAMVEEEIVVFTDASTMFAPDTVQKLVRHFQDPTIGVACGSLIFRGSSESKQTEGVYWNYECALRLMEARLGATLTASGAIYALRRECYRPLGASTMIEDLVVPLRVREQGFRVVYDPEAIGYEIAAESVAGEFTRRVRIATGSFRVLSEVSWSSLKGFSGIAFFSHKVLRWLVIFLLAAILACNLLLVGDPLYRALAAAQVTFYAWAAFGYVFRDHMRRVRFGLVGYFLIAMNLAFFIGFIRYMRGRENAAWEKVR